MRTQPLLVFLTALAVVCATNNGYVDQFIADVGKPAGWLGEHDNNYTEVSVGSNDQCASCYNRLDEYSALRVHHFSRIKISQLEKQLAAATSQLADSFEVAKSLVAELNETYNELDLLSKETVKCKRQLDQNEERFKMTRKQLTEREEELRNLHYQAVNQYVNLTLIGSDIMDMVRDVVWTVSRRIDKKLRRYSHLANPKFHRAKRQTKSKYSTAKKYVHKKVASTKRSLVRHWSRSVNVRPLVEKTWKKVARFTFDVYRPYEAVVNDIKVSLYLTLLSTIEISSRCALNYLDNHVKQKEEKELRKRERDKAIAERNSRHPAMHKRTSGSSRHHRQSPRVKLSTSDDFVVEPPYLHKTIRPLIQFAMDNAEELATQLISAVPLFLTFYLSNSLVIGGVLFFIVCLPNEMIWIFVIVRLVHQMNRFK
eukprot:scaffold49985_cov70-Cyclotella_meneghiniana.AAC.5